MFRRLMLAGGACAALAACANDSPVPTNSSYTGPTHYYAAGVATLRAFGSTQIVPMAASSPVDAPGAPAHLVPGRSGAPALPLLVIRDDARGLALAGQPRREASFTDAEGHAHRIVSLFAPTGGPAIEVQHYLDGALTHTSTNVWEHRGRVWIQRSIHLRQFLPGAPPLEITFSADTLRLSSAAPVRRGGLALVASLARLLTPSAAAQVIPGACVDAYMKYLTAVSISMAAARALQVALMSGNAAAITVAAAAYAVAVANLSYAEWKYLDCVYGKTGGASGPIIEQPTNITLPQSTLAPIS